MIDCRVCDHHHGWIRTSTRLRADLCDHCGARFVPLAIAAGFYAFCIVTGTVVGGVTFYGILIQPDPTVVGLGALLAGVAALCLPLAQWSVWRRFQA